MQGTAALHEAAGEGEAGLRRRPLPVPPLPPLTGAALLQFANAESPVRHHLPPMAPSPPPTPPPPQQSKAPPSPPPPPPQMSPCSDNWTSATASPLLHPPPPPPPPPPSSSWDFWDPFLPSSRSVAEEWEEATTTTTTTTTVSEAAPANAAPPPSSVVGGFSISEDSASELAMVVSRNKKSLSEIVKELDDYFLKAADAGNRVSAFLEAPTCGRLCNYGRSLSPLRWPWGWSSKANQYGGFERLGEASMAKRDAALFGGDFMSHRSTVEKLYAWEKKLYLEVKNAERLKEEHEKKVGLLRRQEARGADYFKMEKTRKEIERLESRLTVASQAMETTSLEIVRVREAELFPQLIELLNRLRAMWRSMYECHQVQTHIVQQLEYLNDGGGGGGGADPTSELHRQSTLQLELEVQRWHSSFCELVESQRDYIHSLAGWLRLSLFGGGAGKPRHHHHHITAEIYSLLEEWQLALDRVPDKVASEGIKSFLTVVHAVVLQQEEEHRQRRRSEAAGRALEKAAAELMRARAEEEKTKWEKSAGITRAMTLNSLQTGFPNVFQAMTGFSGVCTQAFESVYGHRRSPASSRCFSLEREEEALSLSLSLSVQTPPIC
ncbi:unnamed protein product [Spirodela intermedia]|uniref:DUF632 domain-containing protein n=1 Tax=Spirodela intermedia TaxID=51605 RepID=A0A7I8J071_SPIIN|nr:unnamed protein product [Spirodela intermedia]CAA6663223.1 unnamed protein product [Spirodela intermedia]